MKQLQPIYTRMPWLLGVGSGLALCLAQFPYTVWLVFVAVVPLLKAAELFREQKGHLAPLFTFLNTLLAVLCWQVGAAFQLFPFSAELVLVLVLGALPMALAIPLYEATREFTKDRYGALALLSFWLAAEYLVSLQWFGWPFAQLGHIGGHWPQLFTWLGFTGVAGGSAWVLLINYFIWMIARLQRGYVRLTFSLLLPLLITAALWFTRSNTPRTFQWAELQALADGLEPVQAADLPGNGSGFLFQLVSASHGKAAMGIGTPPFVVVSPHVMACGDWLMRWADPDIALFLVDMTGFNKSAWIPLLSLRAVEFSRGILVVEEGEICTYLGPDGKVGTPGNEVMATKEITFFSGSGNYLGRMASLLAVLMFFAGFVKQVTRE